MLRLSRIIHTRVLIAFCMILLMFCISCMHVYAVPDAETPAAAEPVEKWVDLQAQVPEGFKGSVSVLLQQDSTGELYTLTSYPIHDYLNSMLLPTGTYTVMQTFTSEDAFLYDTFLDTESFDLKSGIDLNVTVKENPEGKAFLSELETKQEGQADAKQKTIDEDSESSVADTTVEGEGITADTPDPPTASEQETQSSTDSSDSTEHPSFSSEQLGNTPSSEIDEGASEDTSWAQILKSTLSFLVAVIILAFVFFGVFYVYHRTNE